MESSVKDKLDATYTVGLIRLSLNSPVGNDKTWVLVEGEDDCKIYPKFFQQNKCKVEQVHGGCFQLESAINILQEYNNCVIGIEDADFRHITKQYSSFPNLFYTDCHDIEMTMLHDDEVLKNILYEYSLAEKSEEVKNNILNEVSFIGYVRYYNELNNCEICFDGLGFGNLCIRKGSDINLLQEELLSTLNNRSSNKKHELNYEIIETFYSSLSVEDLFQLVNGHDFIKILAFRLNFDLLKKVSDKDVAKSLRISYQTENFKHTLLYQTLLNWQKSVNLDILN